MARINLSIPDELKDQMDQWPEVNWSKVAQDAFSIQVEIQSLKGKSIQDAGIARLRAQREQNGEKLFAEGVAIGKEWALDRSSYDELERVAKLAEAIEQDAEIDALGLARAYCNEDCNRSDTNALMEDLFGREEPDEALIRGFIEGAAEVLNKV
jgi:hypothetical protein